MDLQEHITTRLQDMVGVVSAYLFGSEAEGRAHRESDVDVGILLSRAAFPEKKDRFEQRLRLSFELARGLGNRIVDVVTLNDAPPTLGAHIITRGVRVFLTDPAADHDFVRDVQLRAADLRPWLERMRRIKLEALSRK